MFFKEASWEILGKDYFKTQKNLKNFARSNGFGFVTINLVEEQVLPQALNGGCAVSKIYGSQRMESYNFWDTPRIKAQTLCHNCDGSCDSCHRTARMGSRKLAAHPVEDFQSEVGDLDWRDNQRPEEQEQDYRAQVGSYGYVPEEDGEEPESVVSLLATGGKMDFIELEKRMLEQDKVQKEATRKREERVRASHVPLSVYISRKEMGENLSPDEEKILAEGLKQVHNEADQATAFHQCGWFTSMRYPELRKKTVRCNLCAKWRQAGDKVWPSRKTQDVSVMNANILVRSTEKVISDAKLVIQGCRNIYRAHLLDHLVHEFVYQLSNGIMPWDVVPKSFMWEDHMDRLEAPLVDLDSIGWFGTLQEVEELVTNIFNSVSKTEKKDAVNKLVGFLQGLRTGKGLKNPPIKDDQKMIAEWLDGQLQSFRLPYSDKFWTPKKFKTPAVCMGCWLQRKGVC